MTQEWNAAEYEVLASPHVDWGAKLLKRVELRGDEAAVDAGCGTGRVTEMLLERLPRGTVLAVDASVAMVEAARERFAGDERVRVERVDLLEFEVGEPVDLVLSTATFHWIKDHDQLFGRLGAALRLGGRLVAQCGGEGNIARVRAAAREVMDEERYRPLFEGWEDPWNFAGPEETRTRLEAVGFEDVEAWLHEEPTGFGSVEELERYLKTVVLGRHLEALSEGEGEAFAGAVAARIGEEGPLVVDYVRLNMLARRSA